MYKILNINNFHYPRGGSDRYFLELTKLLKDKGHSVATFSTSREHIVNPEWMIVDPPAGVNTQSFSKLSDLVNFLYSKDVKKKLALAIEKFKPDLVHLHIYYGQLTASILSILDKYNIPVVQTLHEFKLVCPTHGLYANGAFCDSCQGKKYWKAVIKKCNKGSFSRSFLSMSEAYLSDFLGAKTKIRQFITVSSFQRSQLISLGVKGQNLTTIPLFININESSNDLKEKHSKGDYFLFVGRVHEDKGMKVLLDAYASIQQKKPLLKIVGEGEQLNYWKNYSQQLDIESEVEWLGYKNGQELNDIYNKCLLLINPSLLNETFGLTCLEALSQGKPVIASRIGAFPEVLSEGLDSVLFKANCPSSLALEMKRFMSGELDAGLMGKKGYLNAIHRFDKESHYQKLMKIYLMVLRES